MQQGTIKKLVSDKGSALLPEQIGEDLFFHLSAIKDATFESLYEGQTVEYEAEMGPKGMRASIVKPA